MGWFYIMTVQIWDIVIASNNSRGQGWPSTAWHIVDPQ